MDIFKSLIHSACLKRFNKKSCPNEIGNHGKWHRINFKINRINKGYRNGRTC